MWFSSCLSRLGRKEGKSQGPTGACLPAQPTSSSARHTHRAADAGDIIIVKGRPAGVRIAVGGAPHVGVSGQNTPVHEAEREEAGYHLRWITEPSGSADGCLGPAWGCGWRNVRTRAGSGVPQPSGRTLTCRRGRHLLLGLQHRPGRSCRGLRERPCTCLVCHKQPGVQHLQQGLSLLLPKKLDRTLYLPGPFTDKLSVPPFFPHAFFMSLVILEGRDHLACKTEVSPLRLFSGQVHGPCSISTLEHPSHSLS